MQHVYRATAEDGDDGTGRLKLVYLVYLVYVVCLVGQTGKPTNETKETRETSKDPQCVRCKGIRRRLIAEGTAVGAERIRHTVYWPFVNRCPHSLLLRHNLIVDLANLLNDRQARMTAIGPIRG